MTDPEVNPPTGAPIAVTAGQQDHSDPDAFRGGDADAPPDTGAGPDTAEDDD